MNQIVRSFVRTRENADHHVRSFKASTFAHGSNVTPGEFLKAMAFISGFTVEDIRKDDRGVHMTEIRIALVKAVKGKFPKLSAAKIGAIFNRERTSICRTLRSKQVEGRRSTKLSSLDVCRIRHQYAKGKMNSRMLAEKFGVSHGTVSAIIRFDTYRSVR